MHHLLLNELESSKPYKESSEAWGVAHNRIAKHNEKFSSQHQTCIHPVEKSKTKN